MAVDTQHWIQRAKSSLALATSIPDKNILTYGGDVFYEDLCYELQQCAEKSLKAVLVSYGIDFPKTHDIDLLIKLLRNCSIKLPEKVLDAGIMTQYAVRTRYPDEARQISEEEYKEAVDIAKNVYDWAKLMIKEK
jgi:HEPN domain-containing protein